MPQFDFIFFVQESIFCLFTMMTHTPLKLQLILSYFLTEDQPFKNSTQKILILLSQLPNYSLFSQQVILQTWLDSL